MNFLVLRKYKIFSYTENIKSENLGLYFSFVLHFSILLLAIGLPSFLNQKSISIPNIIPIEIINVSEITSIPKEIKETKLAETKQIKIKEKKFNSSDNQEIKKIEVKDNTKIQNEIVEKKIISKENFLIKEKKKIPIDLRKDNIENLQIKKIKPKLKPKIAENNKNLKINSDTISKPKPVPKKEPDFNIASMLKDLRNEKINQKIESDTDSKSEDRVNKEKENTSLENAQLSISEIDLLRQQLTSCWIAPAGAVIEKGMLVKVSAKLKQNKRILENSVRIVDTNISKSNSFYGPITESAMRTLLNPECIPLKLPEDKYNLWKNLTITFDYSIMKGY